MLKIRLQRIGRRNDPKYRLIIAEQKSKPKSGELEILGSYDPKTNSKTLKAERINHWISKGAQLSDTAHNFLVKNQVISAKKIAVHKIKKEAEKK